MSDKDLNFDKIWGANGDINYDFTDDNYLTGWDFIGNVPPARGMFNRLQHDTDRKQKYLNDQLKALSIKQYTVNDATMPTGNTGLPDTLFSCIGNRIKNITGESDWKSAPAATIRTLKNALDALPNQQYTLDDTKAPATNTATLLTLISNLANEVKQNKGTSDWKTAPATNLATLASLVGNLASGSDVTWEGNKFTNAKLGITGLMEQNGYICFGKNFGGLILQWGFISQAFTHIQEYEMQFPLAFTSVVIGCYTGECTVKDNGWANSMYMRPLNLSTFTTRVHFDGGVGKDVSAYWIALGI